MKPRKITITIETDCEEIALHNALETECVRAQKNAKLHGRTSSHPSRMYCRAIENVYMRFRAAVKKQDDLQAVHMKC